MRLLAISTKIPEPKKPSNVSAVLFLVATVVLPFASNGSGGYYGNDKYNLRSGSSPGIGRPPVFGRGWSDWGKFW